MAWKFHLSVKKNFKNFITWANTARNVNYVMSIPDKATNMYYW